jgi:hypothetical protein
MTLTQIAQLSMAALLVASFSGALRAQIEVLRAGNEPADLIFAQHGRQSPVTPRGRQLLLHGVSFQDPDYEEAERRHMEAHGADRELPFFKQIGPDSAGAHSARADRGDGRDVGGDTY